MPANYERAMQSSPWETEHSSQPPSIERIRLPVENNPTQAENWSGHRILRRPQNYHSAPILAGQDSTVSRSRAGGQIERQDVAAIDCVGGTHIATGTGRRHVAGQVVGGECLGRAGVVDGKCRRRGRLSAEG